MISKYTHKPSTDYLSLREELFDKLYLEVPDDWHLLVKACVFEIYDLLKSKEERAQAISFFQIKEKYGTLRVYYELDLFSAYSLSVSAEEYDRKYRITSEINDIVDYYNKMFQESVSKKE